MKLSFQCSEDKKAAIKVLKKDLLYSTVKNITGTAWMTQPWFSNRLTLYSPKCNQNISFVPGTVPVPVPV